MNLEDKIKQYYKLEEEILKEISKKESFGMECDCDECLIFKTIKEDGEWDEIEAVCINCGGYKEGER